MPEQGRDPNHQPNQHSEDGFIDFDRHGKWIFAGTALAGIALSAGVYHQTSIKNAAQEELATRQASPSAIASPTETAAAPIASPSSSNLPRLPTNAPSITYSSESPTATALPPVTESAAPTPKPTTKPTTKPTKAVAHRLKDIKPKGNVVVVSVDGFNPDSLGKLGITKVPTFTFLRKHGATTLDARTDPHNSVTLPNHTEMFTGLTILGTHVTFDSDNGTTLDKTAGRHISTMFDDTHDNGGSTGMFVQKTKFNYFERSLDAKHGALDPRGVDNGRDKLDQFVEDPTDGITNKVIKQLTTHPDNLTFLHYAYPDAAGHAHGFMSKSYLNAVRHTDQQLGRVVSAIRHNPYLHQHVTLIVTADHGGAGKSHSDWQHESSFKIPFMVYGPGVPQGKDLYSMNKTTRKYPGAIRTDFNGAPAIHNGDVGNLAMRVLGLPKITGSIINAKQDLNIS